MPVQAAVRPLVNVYGLDGNKISKRERLPDVFTAPIRTDIVQSVHNLLSLNTRQPHGVSPKAGHQTSAESWGTGRAVARIPRVRGGGTHRSGQAAYGNMCRGGHMFAPLRIWRKFQHKVCKKLRRQAFAAAFAASAIPALVQARGHAIENLKEVPMVLSNEVESIQKTKEAVSVLKKIGAHDDVERSIASKRLRVGKGKMRNRRYRVKRGPLIIFKNDNGIVKAFRNIPGVTVMKVDVLCLRKVAPGGHPGRLIIWTRDAFAHLETLFGSYASGQTKLSLPMMKTCDLKAIKKNVALTKAVRPPILTPRRGFKKIDPFEKKNRWMLQRLNPAYVRQTELRKQQAKDAPPAAAAPGGKKEKAVAAGKAAKKVAAKAK